MEQEDHVDCQRVREDEMAVAYLRGELSEPDRSAFEQHYFECGDCFQDLEVLWDAQRVLRREKAASGVRAATARPAARPAVWSWAWAASLVLVALAAGVVLRTERPFPPAPPTATAAPAALPSGPPGSPGRPSLETLARVEPPPYVSLAVRGGDREPTSFGRAMEHYVRGSYVAAAAGLRAATREEPASLEARFYFGVSELLAGHPEAAIVELGRVSAGGDDVYADAARFYLAKAHLTRRDVGAARAELQRLARGDGAHSQEARRLLRDLGTEP